MSAVFELFTDKSQNFRFRLKAANGEIILASEGYEQKASAKNGVESVKSNASNEDNFEKKTAVNGKYFFNLLAANNKVIGTSQEYGSVAARDNGIMSVKRNARHAEISDQSE